MHKRSLLFTGLIREFGEVVSYSGENLKINAKHKAQIGDSVAVNGICLTVVELSESSFSVQLSHETRKHIASENLKSRVHIEPAMRLSDRLDGHIVQGHIDGIGKIKSITKDENALDFIIEIPKNLMQFMMPKGSIAIDGVSLTINEIKERSVRLTIIPHTYKHTLFLDYKLNQRVNIESDMFARYVYNMLKRDKALTWDDVDKIMSLY